MGAVAGLHWGSNGWICFSNVNERWDYDHYPSIESGWTALETCELILVTVPVGLPSPETGRRRCDEAAKHLLGPRDQRVFYAPVRSAVYENALDAAKEHNAAADYGIQNQAWIRTPRIREIDEWLERTPRARDVIRETHPAVCFHTLADGPLEHERTTDVGREERLALIQNERPELVEPVEEALVSLTQPRYAPLVTQPADVLDAAVTTATASRHPDLATLPMIPPTDERGIPMGIHYPGDARQLTLGDIEK